MYLFSLNTHNILYHYPTCMIQTRAIYVKYMLINVLILYYENVFIPSSCQG